MKINQDNIDKAGLEHWNQTERNSSIPLEAFDPIPGIRGFGRRQWHEMFIDSLPINENPIELLELGCGGSAFLPYFARRFKYAVSGIDFSKTGIDLTNKLCSIYGVKPKLYCVDFFKAPLDCQERYHAVVSFGVVEHFSDTAATIDAFAKFVRPGGRLLTVVPNMGGFCGLAQRVINRDIFHMHERIDINRLKDAHEKSGLKVIKCEYLLFTNFGVINPGNNPTRIVRGIFTFLKGITALSWILESFFGRFTPNRYTSPYLVCLAEKTIRND